MKHFFSFFFVLIFSISVFAQNAEDYFPQNFGYVWFYKINQLDSNNVPIEENSYWTRDSLVSETVCEGKNAKMIFDAYGSEDVINYVPYVDTGYVALEGSDASLYVDLTVLMDTSLFSDNNFFKTLAALSGWYDLYHFSAVVGLEYQVFVKDTTVVIDSSEIPLRFEIKGMRNSDESLTTDIGTFDCKKFLITSTIYYLQHTPIGDIPIPLVSRENSVWIAPNNWIVKEFAPTREVDFSQIGGPRFLIPGSQKVIKNRPSDVEYEGGTPERFALFQNYPNPFNPTTTIKYSIPVNAGVDAQFTKAGENFTSLRIYNILGEEVATLVNEKQSPGNYVVQFDASNLPSGVYFYTLRVGNFSATKKMILLK